MAMDHDDAATQQGAAGAAEGAAPGGEEVRPPVRSSRDEMLDLIDDENDAALAREYREAGMAMPGSEPEPPPPAAAHGTTDTPGILADDELGTVKIRVRVGDRQEERSVADVVAELSTANGRVRQTAQRNRELEAELIQLRAQQAAAPVVDGAPADDGPGDDLDDVLDRTVTALVDGEVDDARQLLKQLVTTGRPGATPQPAVQLVEESIASRVEERITTKQDWAGFLRDNNDFAEPESELRRFGDYLFATKYGPQVTAGELSYREALDSTAREAREVLGHRREPDPTPQPSGKSEREARKERLENLPAATGGRPGTGAAETSETVDDILDEMRRARGLSV